jgi:hypothetical protein
LSLPAVPRVWYLAAMRALAVLLLALLAAGCGASDADCDKACRNYFQLHYWEEANAEIAGVPVAEREALRQRKLVELEERTNKGIVLCVKQCRTAATKEQVACMLDAKSKADVVACLPKED